MAKKTVKKAIKKTGNKTAKKTTKKASKKVAHKKTKAAGSRAAKKVSAKQQAKTVPTTRSVASLIAAISDERKRDDSRRLVTIMTKITGKPAQVWGGSMIGFGNYHYKYESGREGDMFISGLAPRAQNLVLYVMQGFSESPEIMSRLGKYKTGKSCLYLKCLDDVDPDVLNELISKSVRYMRENYDCT